jgi:hypothetical protein
MLEDTYRRYRDRMYGVMPWLQRVPGIRVLYSDPVLAVVLTVVSIGFLVLGVTLLFGIVDLR